MNPSTIMLVEDEVIVAQDLSQRLGKMGYRVAGPATSGLEAVRLAESSRPDLILMDIELEGDIDGIDAAALIRGILDTPIVYLTAYTDERFVDRAKRTLAYGYLLKPFETGALRASVEVALYKAQEERRQREMMTNHDLCGIITICSACKKIRDPQGEWEPVEQFVERRSELRFSHGICPGCARRLYPQLYE